MTELELFGWSLVVLSGMTVIVWLVLAGCILFSIYEAVTEGAKRWKTKT